MGKSNSADLRVRIYGDIEKGQSCRAVARRFGVAPSTVVRLAQGKARTRSLAPARQGRPAGMGSLAPHIATLIALSYGDTSHRCHSGRRVHVQPIQASIERSANGKRG
jgi:transposase-like protein